ncbi:MAG: 50S ribosomal protein L23 [Candidatus Levybacteria bacterium]|nr:50S ribosomal protein L23 [Candidatus Levybacteria bacterium]
MVKGENSIIRPIITERSMQDANTGKFTFAVNRDSDKKQIGQAVEKQFDVHVVSVATSIVKGRSKRAGKQRGIVKESPWKKAVVKVAKGEKIAVFDIGGDKK